MLMVCSEWQSIKLLVFFAGIIGVEEQAAMVIILQLVNQTFMINYGMQESATILIRKRLEVANVPLAKRYAAVITCLTLLVAFISSAVLYNYQDELIGMFTSDQVVASICIAVCPFYFYYGNLIDAFMVSLQGMIRALGIPSLAFLITSSNLYLISLPLAYAFCFIAEMGVLGLIYGQYCGVSSMTVCLLVAVLVANWQKFAIQAQRRLRTDSAVFLDPFEGEHDGLRLSICSAEVEDRQTVQF